MTTQQPQTNTLEIIASIPINEIRCVINRLKRKYHSYAEHQNSIYAYQYRAKIDTLLELENEFNEKVKRNGK